MTETEFVERTEKLFETLQMVIDQSGLDMDYQINEGVLTLFFDDDSKMIINRHAPTQEVWLATKKGGFYFSFDVNQNWVSAREGVNLTDMLSRLIGEHYGQGLKW